MSKQYMDALRQLAASGVPPGSEITSELTVGLDEFSRIWKDEVLAFVQSGGAELRFIEGPYGRGKTHMLKHLSKISEDLGFLTCYTSCGTDSEPFESLEDTYRAIVRNITWHRNGEILVGLPQILRNLDAEHLELLNENRRTITASLRNLATAYSKLINATAVTASPIHAEIVGDLRELLMGNREHRVVFRRLFRADPSLPRPMAKLSKRNAAIWIRSILALPRALGFRGMIVFFDETGADLHLARVSPKKRKLHMSNLRNLIDHMAVGDTSGCAIVYAVTQDLIEIARNDYPALSQRIERPLPQEIWSARLPNPRAVWVTLDELTDPNPDSEDFFTMLGDRIVVIASKAGLNGTHRTKLKRFIREKSSTYASSRRDDTVRIFVKTIAEHALQHS